MNIILIGFMGSGKSSVARVLSEKLDKEFVDMDNLVLQKSGRKNINEIFEEDGEAAFRNLEKDVSLGLQNKNNIVIATGGGVVQNKLIMDALKKTGTIIYLDTPFEIIQKRLSADESRPLFKNKNNARELYDARKKLYEEYSDITINTEYKNTAEIGEEIILALKT